MKILALFDLHYIANQPICERKIDEINEIEENIDAIVLGGDNAEIFPRFKNHSQLIERLRKKYFSVPLGFILGNHELWARALSISAQRLIYDIFPEIAHNSGLIYLENQNMQLPGLTIAGTYAHYDFSFINPDGKITLEDLRNGSAVIDKNGKRIQLGWADKKRIDLDGQTDEDLCGKLLKDFEDRIKNVSGELITISHTVPSKALNGYPNSPEQDFYETYGGSTRLERILANSNSWLHLCGHTHARAEGKIGETRVINIGADYDLLRCAIIDTKTKQVETREKKIA